MLDFTAVYQQLILAVITSKPLYGMQEYPVVVLALCILSITEFDAIWISTLHSVNSGGKGKGHPDIPIQAQRGGEGVAQPIQNLDAMRG
jgi:hypothetical protein